MNDTLWWDNLEGDSLACRPGHANERRFAVACMVSTVLTPAIVMVFGIFLLQKGLVSKAKLRRAAAMNDAAPTMNTAMHSGGNSHNRKRGSRMERRKSSHGTTLTLVVSVILIGVSANFLLTGHGTKYGTDTWQGKIGDACCKSSTSCLCVLPSSSGLPGVTTSSPSTCCRST
jgi:hypothetical protein